MRKDAFMIMPFSDPPSDHAYHHCIKPICEEFELNIRRADEIFTTNPVYDDIVSEIVNASVIIADLSGRRANVFYELGIAHNLKQSQTIMVTHEDLSNAPFDISHFRIVQYEDSIEGGTKFKENLRKTLNNVFKDLKSIHKDEFNLVIEVMTNAGNLGELVSVIGLADYPGVIYRHDPLDSEGGTKDDQTTHSSVSVENALSPLARMGYVDLSQDIVRMTDLGKAFVDTLKEKGFKCDYFNGHKFTEGYLTLYERMVASD